MRVGVFYPKTDLRQLSVFLHNRKYFKKAGFDLEFRPDESPDFKHPDHDLFLVQNRHVTQETECTKPVIVFEERDSCTPVRGPALSNPSVRRICKQGILPFEQVNLDQTRVHERLLPGGKAERLKKSITPEQYQKLTPFYHFGNYDRLRSVRAEVRETERTHDTTFIGIIEENRRVLSIPGAILQRKKTVEILSKRQNSLAITSRRLPLNEYTQHMNQSKIAVSPFGMGEICYRDFEAWLCGNILIKPRVDHIRMLQRDLFKDGETYIACEWDLSDLDEKIDWCLKNYGALEPMRLKGRETMQKLLSSEYIVQCFETLVQSLSVTLDV